MKKDSNKVIDSIKELKKDINKNPESFFSEYDLQGRLYYHLCKEYKSEYPRIHLEYFPPEIKYDKEQYKSLQEKCLKKYGPKNTPYKIIPIEKKGKYDLVVLDNQKKKLLHVIELKKINSYCKSNYHKGYEDIYLLTDLLDNFKGSNSYFFIYAVCNSRYKVKKEGMQDYINNVEKTYKNADKLKPNNNINFDYYIYDKNEK